MPTLQAFFTNMSVKLPLHKNIYIILRYSLMKMSKRKSCCVPPGEPSSADSQWNNLLVKRQIRPFQYPVTITIGDEPS